MMTYAVHLAILVSGMFSSLMEGALGKVRLRAARAGLNFTTKAMILVLTSSKLLQSTRIGV